MCDAIAQPPAEVLYNREYLSNFLAGRPPDMLLDYNSGDSNRALLEEDYYVPDRRR